MTFFRFCDIFNMTSVGDHHKELYENSDFAVVCSFFNKFGAILGLKPYPFTKLENIFTFDDKGKSTV